MRKDLVLILCVIQCSLASVMETRNPQPVLRDGKTDNEPYQYRKVTSRGQHSCWLMGGGK